MISSMKTQACVSVAAAGASKSTWCKNTEEFLGKSLRNSERYRQSLQRLMHVNFQLKEKYIFAFITSIYIRCLLKRKCTTLNDRTIFITARKAEINIHYLYLHHHQRSQMFRNISITFYIVFRKRK